MFLSGLSILFLLCCFGGWLPPPERSQNGLLRLDPSGDYELGTRAFCRLDARATRQTEHLASFTVVGQVDHPHRRV